LPGAYCLVTIAVARHQAVMSVHIAAELIVQQLPSGVYSSMTTSRMFAACGTT